MFRTISATLALLVVTALGAEAQGRSHSDPDPGPVRALLDVREEIGLTDDQVTRLRRIDEEMHRLNDPIVARLMVIRKEVRGLPRRSERTAEQRVQYEAYLEQARPLWKQIRENNHRAMKQVGRVLTDDQREVVARLLRNDDDDDRSNRSSRDQGLPG